MGKGETWGSEASQEMLAFDGEACHVVRDYVAHFANPLRLRILCVLATRRASVGELVDITGARQPSVSHQLNLLRLSGVVTRTREGNRNVYELADPVAREMMEFILGLAERLMARRSGDGATGTD